MTERAGQLPDPTAEEWVWASGVVTGCNLPPPAQCWGSHIDARGLLRWLTNGAGGDIRLAAVIIIVVGDGRGD